MKILFLEQDRATRRLVKDMLENAGAALIEMTPEAATELPEATMGAAIAIVEVGGAPDSFGLIARLHAREAGRPAVIAVANDSSEVEQSRRAGADEVLVEPVAMTALFEAIARYLPEG